MTKNYTQARNKILKITKSEKEGIKALTICFFIYPFFFFYGHIVQHVGS